MLFDALLLAIPAFAGVLLIVGAVSDWSETGNVWYAFPAMGGLFSLLTVLVMLVTGPTESSVSGWSGAVFWIVIGAISYMVIRAGAEQTA